MIAKIHVTMENGQAYETQEEVDLGPVLFLGRNHRVTLTDVKQIIIRPVGQTVIDINPATPQPEKQ